MELRSLPNMSPAQRTVPASCCWKSLKKWGMCCSWCHCQACCLVKDMSCVSYHGHAAALAEHHLLVYGWHGTPHITLRVIYFRWSSGPVPNAWKTLLTFCIELHAVCLRRFHELLWPKQNRPGDSFLNVQKFKDVTTKCSSFWEACTSKRRGLHGTCDEL